MKSDTSMKDLSFRRYTSSEVLVEGQENNMVRTIDQDVSSCASSKKFIRRQQRTITTTKEKPKAEADSMQFMTTKKLLQLRNIASQQTLLKSVSKPELQECPESQNCLPTRSVVFNTRKEQTPQRRLEMVQVPERKILDCRTRPSTPAKDADRSREDKRIKLLQNRIAELEAQLDSVQSLKDKCTEYQALLEANSLTFSKQQESFQKLTVEYERKQLEIDLLKDELYKNGNRSYKKIPITTKRIKQSPEFLELQSENKALKQEVESLKQTVMRMDCEIQRLRKTNKNQSDQIIELESTRKNRLREDLSRQQSEREKFLEGQINQLKSQLEAHKDTHQMTEQLRQLQEDLLKAQKELNYSHMAEYCTKRQLEQSRNELSLRVAASQYNELKNRLKKLSLKHRQMVKKAAHKDQEQFQLTPEKELRSSESFTKSSA